MTSLATQMFPSRRKRLKVSFPQFARRNSFSESLRKATGVEMVSIFFSSFWEVMTSLACQVFPSSAKRLKVLFSIFARRNSFSESLRKACGREMVSILSSSFWEVVTSLACQVFPLRIKRLKVRFPRFARRNSFSESWRKASGSEMVLIFLSSCWEEMTSLACQVFPSRTKRLKVWFSRFARRNSFSESWRKASGL